MTDFTSVQEQILDDIETLGEAYKFSVYDGAVPTGDELKSTNGKYWPYVVVGFGGKTEVSFQMQGIVSSADDVKWTSLIFFVVGDTPKTVRRLKHLIRKQFEGRVASTGWGQFVEVLTGDFGISKPDPDLTPLRFGETLAFRAIVDVD